MMGKMSDNKNGMNSAIVSQIRAVLDEVKSAAIASLDSLSALSDRRPTDLSKFLKIDMKLAWKLSRLTRANTMGEILHAVAGSAGVRKTLQGLKQAGAEQSATDRLDAAFESMREMIGEIAGDRSALETIVTGFGEAESLQLSVEMRRKYYASVCSMVGVQCTSQYRMMALGTNPVDGTLSAAAIHSFKKLRQFSFHGGISFFRPTEFSGCYCCAFESSENLDTSVEGPIPLLPEFSDLTRIEFATSSPDSSYSGPNSFHRVDENLGIQSTADVVLGEIAHRLSPMTSGSERMFQDCVELRVPTRELTLDYLIEPGLMPLLSEPEMTMKTLWSATTECAGGDCGTLPVQFSITKLRPRELDRLPPEGWSRSEHARLCSLVDSRTQWSISEFDHFRITLSFPFMPSKLETLIQMKPKAR